MALAAEPFETVVIRNCPPEGAFYFCERLGSNGLPVRFPIGRALSLHPFEWPAGAKPGPWMIHYTRDAQASVVIPNAGARVQVIATLTYPAEVCDPPDGASDAELAKMLAGKEEEVEDDEEGSLKATRLDAKKREIALDLTAKEQKLVRRAGVNKELTEGYLLNRAHRLEVRDQSEAMFRVQNQTLAMSERNLVLIEKIQESLGRVAELEKEASRKVASPPAPIDYSPVLNGVVGAIRDIGVSALQRDHKPRPKLEDGGPAVKATLTEQQPSPEQFGAVAANPPASMAPETAMAASILPPATQPSMAELLAALGRTQAERDRLKSELEAERQRQIVLAELSPKAQVAAPTKTAERPRPAEPQAIPTPAQPPEPVQPAQSARPENAIRAAEPKRAIEPAQITQIEPTPAPVDNSEPTGIPKPGPTVQRSEPTRVTKPAPPPQQIQSAPIAGPERATTSGPNMKAGQVLASPPTVRRADSSKVEDALDIPAAQHPTPSLGKSFTPRASRNASCPCGSGRKYKKCCLAKDQRATEADSSRSKAQTTAAANIASAGNGAKAAASPSDSTVAAPTPASTTAGQDPSDRVEVSPSSAPSPELQELLVNAMAGRMLADPDKPIPTPMVNSVELIDEVIVAPSNLDPETAHKLLKDGTALEAFGAYLFFNPAIRTMLLSRRGSR